MGAPQNPLNDPDKTTGGDFLFDEVGKDEGRRAFSPHDLMSGLSAMIQTCEGCAKVSVIEVTRLDEPDTSGCNWSTSVVLDPGGVIPEIYSLAYASVIFMARTSWNLK